MESDEKFNFLVQHEQKNLGFYETSVQKLSVKFDSQISLEFLTKFYILTSDSVNYNKKTLD